jgi:spore coat protein U-like protein
MKIALTKRLFAFALLMISSTTAYAVSNCTVGASGVSFGIYDPLSGSADDSTGQVSVTCTATFPPIVDTVNYTVSLSSGSSGSYSTRRMQAGSSVLNYNLYTTSARSAGQIWGDTTGGSANMSGSMTIGFFFWPTTHTDLLTIYGRIPAGQDVAAGTYADTIIVTVTF